MNSLSNQFQILSVNFPIGHLKKNRNVVCLKTHAS